MIIREFSLLPSVIVQVNGNNHEIIKKQRARKRGGHSVIACIS